MNHDAAAANALHVKLLEWSPTGKPVVLVKYPPTPLAPKRFGRRRQGFGGLSTGSEIHRSIHIVAMNDSATIHAFVHGVKP